MADSLAKLLLLIEGKDNASPAFNSAGAAAKSLGSELTKIGQIAGGVAIGGLGAQLGMSLSQHFKDALTEVETFGDQVFKLQQRIGVSSESASGLLSVFERFGVSSDSANRMLTFFSRGLRGQADESEGGALAVGKFQGTLAELGVSAIDTAGHFRPIADVLTEVQDKMSRFKGDGDTAARSMALFGRAGAEASPIFNLTSQEFARLQEEAQRLGVTLSQSNVNQIRTLAMAHHDLDEAVRGLTIQLGTAFIPVLTDAAKEVASFAGDMNKDGTAAKSFADGIKGLSGRLRELFSMKPPEWFDRFLHLGEDVGKSLPGGKGVLGTAEPLVDAMQNGIGPAPPSSRTLLDFSSAMGGLPSLAAGAMRPDHATHEGQIGAQNARALADQERSLSRSERLIALDQADIAGKRGLEVIQHQINVLQRQNLDLVNEQGSAELAMIPLKQAQADLDLKLLETQDKRAQLAREGAVTAARLAGMPAAAALEDNQYRQQLIQAQIKAGVLSGQGIPEGAIAELIGLTFAEPGLEVPALQAGHEVTLAERSQQQGQLQNDLDTLPLREEQAVMALDLAREQRDLDRISAQLQRDNLSKVTELVELEKARVYFEDNLFRVGQARADLAGTTVNVTMNVSATGQADYDQLVKDLADAVQRGVSRGTGRTESPPPAGVPGGGFTP